MNALGLFLLGAALRGAAFATVGVGLARLLRRKGPAASAMLALATLVGMLGVAALGVSPWPRWRVLPAGGLTFASASRGASNPRAGSPAEASAPSAPTAPAMTGIEAAPETKGVAGALKTLGEALMGPAVAPELPGWSWPAWVAVAAVIGVVVGVGRFALGIAAVGALRRGSRGLDDPDLLELASVLSQRLGVPRRVEVRVSPALAMPATVGWLRPLVLLPEDWPSWDEAERRAVLSHELAHIRRKDYLAAVGAQLSLALQFYHPLAHWLARRLRLDMERAADAGAAALSGGNRAYLATLARMALRVEPRPVGWAARSFSPARGTFLRRIEMLRDSQDVSPAPLSRRSRAVALGALAVAALAAAGLRGPTADGQALAAPPPQAAAGGEGISLDGGFVPADAGMVFAARPAELVARQEIKQLLEPFQAADHVRRALGVGPEDIAQVTLVWLQGQATATGRPRGGPPEPAGVILRTTRPNILKPVSDIQPGVFSEEVRFGDHSYTRLGQGETRECYARPDDRTLIYGLEPNMIRMLAARPGDAERAAWATGWKTIDRGQVSLGIDTSWLATTLPPMAARRPGAGGSPLDGFEPLVSKARSYAVGFNLLDDIKVDGLASCGSEADAKRVADTLKATLTLARNSLDGMKIQSTRADRQAPAAVGLAVDLGGPLVDGAEVKVDGKTVRISAQAPAKAGQFAAMLAPALQAQRAAARRAQSVNNMKQLALAMHNYASEHGGRFPAAVMIGPDGKTPYSWRIAVLPYIEQNELYKQYNFTEPWDGPNNRKLLDKMPIMFGHPLGDGKSSSYFMPTGPHTVSPDNQGSSFAQITDGTSNTILLVEAKRDIPWTKPEDIPVPTLADGPDGGAVPPLGGFNPGGFNAAFADGSVRFISDKANPVTLKALFSRDGGEVVAAGAF